MRPLKNDIVVARKQHWCHTHGCNRAIKKGEKYRRIEYRENGGLFTRKLCLYCDQAAKIAGAGETA